MIHRALENMTPEFHEDTQASLVASSARDLLFTEYGDILYQPNSNLFLRGRYGVAKVISESTNLDASGIPARGTVESSGFFVSADGSLVTTAYAVSHANRIDVETYDGHRYGARVVKVDSADDLAVLQIDKNASSESFGTLQLAPSGLDRPKGTPVLGLGYPGGHHQLAPLTGCVDRSTDLENMARPDSTEDPHRKQIVLDMHVDPGASGPILNRQGMVLGLIDRTDTRDKASAIPVETIRRFLDLK